MSRFWANSFSGEFFSMSPAQNSNFGGFLPRWSSIVKENKRVDSRPPDLVCGIARGARRGLRARDGERNSKPTTKKEREREKIKKMWSWWTSPVDTHVLYFAYFVVGGAPPSRRPAFVHFELNSTYI